MSPEELDIIRAAVENGHPLAIQAFAHLEAEAAAVALADEEEARAAQIRLADFALFDSIQEEAEASTHQVRNEAIMQVEEGTEEVVDDRTMVESEEEMQLDLLDVDIVNKNTSHGKATDATSTKRVYKRVSDAFQRFLVVVEKHPSNAGLSSFNVYLPEQTHDYVNRKLVRLFVKTYVRSLGYSQSHYTEAINFLQRLLEDQMSDGGCVARKGSIKDDRYLKDYLKEVHIIKADLERESDIDIQEGLDSFITRAQELCLVDICYDLFRVSTLQFLAKSNVACGYVHSAQVGTRGSDSRALLFHHGFIRKMEFLGDGDDVDHFIHNQGKTNRVGRREYKAFATHKNPRMDTSAHLGINLLLRFVCHGEPFPDFLSPKEYTHRPIFRSISCYSKSYPPSTQYNNWKAIYNAAGIRCNKVTHQNRGQVQQRLSDLGCPLDTIERFIGYAGMGQKQMNTSMKDSYLHTPPVQPVCGAADGDPQHPDLHKPGWDIDLLPGELATLCPWLYRELKKVEIGFHMYPDHAIRTKMCLFQARGCLLAFERRIGQAVKMLASLPLNEKNLVLLEEPPLHKRWANHPVCILDFFQSPAFQNIMDRVQKGQRQESFSTSNELTSRQKNWVTQEMNKITPKLNASARLSQAILQGQQQAFSEVVRSLEGLHTKTDWIIDQLVNNGKNDINTIGIYKEDAGVDVDGDSVSIGSPLPATTTSVIRPPRFVSTNTNSIATFNPLVNSKGKKRKHCPPSPVLNRPFSSSNLTAHDYWMEYKYGVNGHPSLESLESAHGSKWRSDTAFSRVDGKKGTSLKAAWSLQRPIYYFIQYHMDSGQSEQDALLLIQEVFDRFSYRHSGRPKLKECKKEFVSKWGGTDVE